MGSSKLRSVCAGIAIAAVAIGSYEYRTRETTPAIGEGLSPAEKVELAKKYHYGDGVPHSFEVAYRLFEEAARDDNVEAMFHVGEIHLDGGRGARRQPNREAEPRAVAKLEEQQDVDRDPFGSKKIVVTREAPQPIRAKRVDEAGEK